MRLTAKRSQYALQFVERGPRQAYYLASIINWNDASNPRGADNDYIAIVAFACRTRAASEARVGCLHDYYRVVFNAKV